MSKETKVKTFITQQYGNSVAQTIEQLSESGSNRNYYRFLDDNISKIICYSENISENETFIYFTDLLQQIDPNISPKIELYNNLKTMYVQNDLGKISLMDYMQNHSNIIHETFEDVIEHLVKIQFEMNNLVDYNCCYSYQNFDSTLALRDLYQFKFYFLNALEVPFVPNELLEDFKKFARKFQGLEPQGFVFRDFQSRNIMMQSNEPVFIDYQGGLKGPIVYDLVSLIWQAKANFSMGEREQFYQKFESLASNYYPEISVENIRLSYEYTVVIRVLQTLGAYGLRGLIEGKKHFKESIAFGLQNLEIIKDFEIMNLYPALQKVISAILSDEIQAKLKTKLNGK